MCKQTFEFILHANLIYDDDGRKTVKSRKFFVTKFFINA